MDYHKLFKISVPFLAFFFVLNISSCADNTNISKAEIKEHISRIDGECSNWLNASRKPLILINDKVVSDELLNRIKLEHIDSVSLLKCKEAIKIYANKAKYGALQIYANEKIFTDLKTEITINSEHN